MMYRTGQSRAARRQYTRTGLRAALAALALMLCFGVSAFGAVAVDATSRTEGNAASFTWTHTVSGTDRLLIVGVSSFDPVSSVSYNGKPMTLLRADEERTGVRSEIWYVVSPDTGTHNIDVVMTAAEDTVCGAVSFTGVDTGDPFNTPTGTTGRAWGGSVSVTSAADELVVDVIAFRGGDGNVAAGGGQTEQYTGESGTGGWDIEGGCSTEAGAASVTMSWSFSARDRYALTAVSIRPPPAGRTQGAYRWLGSEESAVESESTPYTTATPGDLLHLRVGVRKNGASWTTHRLGLQYDTNSSFSSPAMLPAGASWDDADHADGDAVTSTVLAASTASGEYHEGNVTSTQVKSLDTTYEEDFAVRPTATGTYYLRVVEVNADGSFKETLDNYGPVITITVVNAALSQSGFAWAPDTGPAPNDDPATDLVWTTEDATATVDTNAIYILSTQLALDSNIGNGNWVLEYQEDYDTASPGPWTEVDGSGVWDADNTHNCDLNNGETIQTSWYSQSVESGYTLDTGEFSNDGNGLTDGYSNGDGVELWWAVTATDAARGHSYRFRVVRTGISISYNIFATAICPAVEQVSYRWLESNEAAAAPEDAPYETIEDAKLHLRVGVRSNLADWNGRYLALQRASNASFTADVALVTPTSANFKTWDDPDHTTGDLVEGTKLLTGSLLDGPYAESNVVSSFDYGSGDYYEIDFTVQVNYLPPYNTDDYWYFRVVEVDSSGALVGPVDIYGDTIELVLSAATNVQSAYNWADDEATLAWQGTDQPLQFSPGQTYILAIQYERTYSGDSSDWAWELQYQEDPDGQPGPWTDVTFTSDDWRTTNNAETYNGHNNGDAVDTTDFVCGAGTGSAADGEYSNDDNGATYAWTGDTYAEFWYPIEAQASAANKTYAFRVIRSGGTSALGFNVFARAVQVADRQVSFRWADDDGAALAAENSIYTAATGQQLHLRVGVKRQGADWSTHRLGLQVDTDSSFSSPTLVTTATSDLAYWDDADQSDGDTVGSVILSGSPSGGEFHESNVTSAETKTADTLYEEDFAVQVTTEGVYYLRVVEVDASGNYVGTLEEYDQAIRLEAVDPSDDQTNYNWAPDAAVAASSLAWQGEGSALAFTAGTTYILAVQVKHTSASDSEYDWTLQYQRDPDGVPGAWTAVTSSSSDWQIDGAPAFVAIANEGSIATGNFDISSPGGTPSPTATAGEFSSDSNGATHTLSGNP
ncbi:MAG: hypothetical protein ACOCX4_08075, partial [Planctomycetota bacterium]